MELLKIITTLTCCLTSVGLGMWLQYERQRIQKKEKEKLKDVDWNLIRLDPKAPLHGKSVPALSKATEQQLAMDQRLLDVHTARSEDAVAIREATVGQNIDQNA